MKRLKSLTIVSIMFIMIGLISTTNAKVFSEKSFESGDKIESSVEDSFLKNIKFFDSLEYSQRSIFIDGNTEVLYKEFSNRSVALEELKKDNIDFISYLTQTFGVEELSNSNWKRYHEIIISEDIDEKYDMEILLFRKFFDIYENTDKNNEINKMVDELDSSELSSVDTKESIINELVVLFPNYTKFANKIKNVRGVELKEDFSNIFIKQDFKEIRSSDTNIVNLSDAVNYAQRFAYNPNEGPFYYFHNGDCANFVSQIMQSSGRPTTAGWWHRITKDWLGNYVHEHAPAWSMVNTFVHYFGVSNSTKSNREFSAILSAGSIIAFDSSDDGDWDHVAFVTESDNYIGTYSGYTYFDYKVAQHTRNYHAWTSSSENNWEKIGSNGGRYALVRR